MKFLFFFFKNFKGGFHKVVEQLENIATKKHDAKFIYNSPIEKIIIDENKVAKGIRLENGEEKYADIVVCNAGNSYANLCEWHLTEHNIVFFLDLVYAYNKLLPKTKYAEQIGEKSLFTSSSISFYWGLKRKITGLHAHNIFMAEEYKASFDDIFKKHSMPKDPSFYIHVPSHMDSTGSNFDIFSFWICSNYFYMLTIEIPFLNDACSCAGGKRNFGSVTSSKSPCTKQWEFYRWAC